MMVTNTLPSGWTLKGEIPVADYPFTGTLCEHDSSGARVLFLKSSDPESMGAFCFPTHSTDNTGVAHILEHSVLCGSKKYPGPATFFQLYRTSLSSFLNALTYPTATIYPFGSPLEADFLNLMDVFGDAVFFPLLREATFLQEGWRIENKDGKKDYTGVVYNEMRGAMGSADAILDDKTSQSLWSDGPLSFNSGGDPKNIPDLTYQNFLEFHKRWYHPSECLVYLYGDLDLNSYLQLLHDRFFIGFQRRSRSEPIFPQKRKDKPLNSVLDFPFEPGGMGAFSLSWLTEGSADLETRFSLDFLHGLLLRDGGLLRRVILDSGLAEDIDSLSHRSHEPSEGSFIIGLKGVPLDRLAGAEAFLLEELKKLTLTPFPSGMVEAELLVEEFQLKEIERQQGLRTLFQLYPYLFRPDLWETVFNQTGMLADLRRRWESGENVFGKLIQEYLLDNPHRSTLIFHPKQAYFEEQEADRIAPLETFLKTKDPALETKLEKQAELLKSLQAEPPAVNLPALSREELPRKVPVFPLEELGSDPGISTYLTTTNGIAYLDIRIDASGLGREDFEVIGLLTKSLGSLGLKGLSYDLLVRKQKSLWGGARAQFSLFRALSGEALGEIRIRVKILKEKLEEGLGLLGDVFLNTDWGEKKRLSEWLTEQQHELYSSLLYHGNTYADYLASAAIDPLSDLYELSSGVSLYQNLKLSLLSEKNIENLGVKMGNLWRKLAVRSRMTALWTGDKDVLKTLENFWPAFMARLPEGTDGKGFPGLKRDFDSTAVLLPLDVGFLAVSLPFKPMAEDFASLQILESHLSLGPLHQRIREKGGAYGTNLGMRLLEGRISFTTYRDPRLFASLKDFHEVLEEGSKFEVPQAEIDSTLLGVIGGMIAPIPPKDRGYFTWSRDKMGLTTQVRQKLRNDLFNVGPDGLRRVCGTLLTAWDQRGQAALTGTALWSKDPFPSEKIQLLDLTKED